MVCAGSAPCLLRWHSPRLKVGTHAWSLLAQSGGVVHAEASTFAIVGSDMAGNTAASSLLPAFESRLVLALSAALFCSHHSMPATPGTDRRLCVLCITVRRNRRCSDDGDLLRWLPALVRRSRQPGGESTAYHPISFGLPLSRSEVHAGLCFDPSLCRCLWPAAAAARSQEPEERCTRPTPRSPSRFVLCTLAVHWV
jgi:hypothetical protein